MDYTHKFHHGRWVCQSFYHYKPQTWWLLQESSHQKGDPIENPLEPHQTPQEVRGELWLENGMNDMYKDSVAAVLEYKLPLPITALPIASIRQLHIHPTPYPSLSLSERQSQVASPICSDDRSKAGSISSCTGGWSRGCGCAARWSASLRSNSSCSFPEESQDMP